MNYHAYYSNKCVQCIPYMFLYYMILYNILLYYIIIYVYRLSHLVGLFILVYTCISMLN